MTFFERASLFLLRVALGWLYLYAGVTKLLDPKWSAAGYLKGAKNFPELYNFLGAPNVLPATNFLNKWGLTLIGVSLILGILVRWSALFAILLMALYYLPILNFPYAGEHSYIVDEHIIYILALFVLISARAGRYWGLERS